MRHIEKDKFIETPNESNAEKEGLGVVNKGLGAVKEGLGAVKEGLCAVNGSCAPTSDSKTRLSELENKLQEILADIETLKMKNAAKDDIMLDKLSRQVETLASKVSRLEVEERERITNLAHSKITWDTMKKADKSTIEEKWARLQSLKKRKTLLDVKVWNIKGEMAYAEAKNAAETELRSSEIGVLEVDIQSVMDSIEKQENEVNDLKGEHDRLQEYYRLKSTEMNERVCELTLNRNQCQDRDAQLVMVRKELEDKTNSLKLVHFSEHSEWQLKIDELQQTIEKLNLSISINMEICVESKTVYDELEKKKKEDDEEDDRRQIELVAIKNDCSTQKMELQQLTEQIQEDIVTLKVQDSAKKLHEKTKINQLREDISDLKKDIGDKECDVEWLRNNYDELKLDHIRLIKLNNKITKDMEMELMQLTDQHEEKEFLQRSLENQKMDLQDLIQETNSGLELLQQTSTRQEQQRTSNALQVANLESSLENSRNSESDLLRQLKDVAQQNKMMDKRISDLTDEYTWVSRELEEELRQSGFRIEDTEEEIWRNEEELRDKTERMSKLAEDLEKKRNQTNLLKLKRGSMLSWNK